MINYHMIRLDCSVAFNNQTGSILVHICPLIYINLHVKYGKQSDTKYEKNK